MRRFELSSGVRLWLALPRNSWLRVPTLPVLFTRLDEWWRNDSGVETQTGPHEECKLISCEKLLKWHPAGEKKKRNRQKHQLLNWMAVSQINNTGRYNTMWLKKIGYDIIIVQYSTVTYNTIWYHTVRYDIWYNTQQYNAMQYIWNGSFWNVQCRSDTMHSRVW